MTKISSPTAPPQVPSTLNLSQQDFDNLVAVIADALNGSRSHQNNSGLRYFTIPKSDKGGMPSRKLHLQIPQALENLSDNDPQVISWIMSAITRSEYSPGVYRKITDFIPTGTTGALPAFRSHKHRS